MKIAGVPGTDSAFQQIKSRALSHWQELYDGTKPVIMIGTATCGKAAGALDVLQAMRRDLIDTLLLFDKVPE